MIFWDSSALVPLCVQEAATPAVRQLLGKTADVAFLASRAEILSALCRRQREGALSEDAVLRARARRDTLLAAMHMVHALDEVVRRADRLLLVHPLRAADAMQLGAALVAASDAPEGHGFATFDERLARAAAKEGFATPCSAKIGRG